MILFFSTVPHVFPSGIMGIVTEEALTVTNEVHAQTTQNSTRRTSDVRIFADVRPRTDSIESDSSTGRLERSLFGSLDESDDVASVMGRPQLLEEANRVKSENAAAAAADDDLQSGQISLRLQLCMHRTERAVAAQNASSHGRKQQQRANAA